MANNQTPEAPTFDPSSPYQAAPAPSAAPTTPTTAPSAAPVFNPNAPYQAAEVPQGSQTSSDTGIWAGVKRNTVGAITNLYHAVTDPASDQEKQELLQSVRDQNARGNKVPEDLATNPSQATLVMHRILTKPSDTLNAQSDAELAKAKQLWDNGEHFKGANLSVSGAVDKVLSAIPLVGPMIGGIANRAERGDVSGAATDVAALMAAENAPAAVRGVVKKVPIPDLVPEWLKKVPDTPAPQHGTPVTVESPLDSATLSKQLGGKDLSPEALKTLQQHVGDKVPVGSTAKNMLTKAVEPVVKTINDTASKMNDTVKNAQPFQQSVMDDGKVQNTFDQLKKNIPPSVRKALSEDVDGVLEGNQQALASKDPAEVLEQRRLLGKRIDWDNIINNPSTPSEVQNLARVKMYRLLGDKIHTEIPETVPLDKILQPNLELRSHMTTKLGERVVDDPIAATVEHQTEFNKGRTTIENQIHNAKVARNRAIALAALSAAGAGGVGGVVVKHLLP